MRVNEQANLASRHRGCVFSFKESTFWDRVAILLHDLIVYHYFSDGNKKIAITKAVPDHTIS
ncbi:MAG: Fic family protein [Promethearchaeota archaeon]